MARYGEEPTLVDKLSLSLSPPLALSFPLPLFPSTPFFKITICVRKRPVSKKEVKRFLTTPKDPFTTFLYSFLVLSLFFYF
jgi:hypothetical protein